MELISTAVNATLLLLIGGLLGWQMNGRFRAMEARFTAVENRIDNLQRSVDGLRSDLTQVALALGVRRESGTGR